MSHRKDFMLSYFFTYQSDLPSEYGFSFFDRTHLCFLTGSAVFLLFLCIFFLHAAPSKQKQIQTTVTLLALILTLTQDLILTVTGHMDVGMLPLHLCDLAGFFYLAFLLPVPSHFYRLLKNAAVCVFLPGAASALLFPDWTMYPPIHYMTFHGFFYHTLIVACPLLLLCSHQVHPRLKDFPQTALFLLSLALSVYLFDLHFNCNYMFLQKPPEGSPLEVFSRLPGAYGYTVGYMLSVSVVLFFIFLFFEFLAHKMNQHASTH